MIAPSTNGVARHNLPSRRKSFTHEVYIAGQQVILTCGLKEDGTLGEIFIDLHKYGSALRGWAGDTAQLFSIALQHNIPLSTLVKPFIHSRSEPCGAVEGHPRIKYCTSVMDFVAQVLTEEFLQPDTEDKNVPPTTLDTEGTQDS